MGRAAIPVGVVPSPRSPHAATGTDLRPGRQRPIVVLSLGHDIFSQLQVAARYYYR